MNESSGEGYHLELIVEANPGADRGRLRDDLQSYGLDPLPMRVGFLLSADRGALRRLVPSLSGDETSDLPVPPPLRSSVKSIRVVKPRSLQTP
jgi:hypothetical protein